MKMNIDFASHVYEIEFIPFLGESEDSYQEGFNDWYYEPVEYRDWNGEVRICFQQRSDLCYDYLDIDTVLDWFKFASPDCGVAIVAECSGDDCDRSLPTLYF